MPTPPRVSIILPCRNERWSIERCLRSVLSQESPTGGFEVLLAEGASESPTATGRPHLPRSLDHSEHGARNDRQPTY